MNIQTTCVVRVAQSYDTPYAEQIAQAINESAAKRNKALSPRTPEYIARKMLDGLAIIAVDPSNGQWGGFCCIEVWQHRKYIANSGLIVAPVFRGQGLSKKIKEALFTLGRKRFPYAKMFSLTTCPAVISANTQLGYQPVSFDTVMKDKYFLLGNQSCVDYANLMRSDTGRYVAMVYTPAILEKRTRIARPEISFWSAVRNRRFERRWALAHS